MDHLNRTKKLPTITIALDYARLSKDRKKLSENVGIQHRECVDFIDDQEWEHGGSYADNDISASEFGTKTRDDYLRMIQDIQDWADRKNALIKLVIVVTEMPRLYRQVEELLPLIKMAENTKLSGIWTTDGEGYDLSTPEGIHRAIGAVNNAMLESKRASKRQRRKKKVRAARGEYMGGNIRYGFEGPIKDEHGNIINRGRINIAEIPEQVKHLEDWWDRLIAGESQASIIKSNHEAGIAAARGGKWTVGNFKRLVTNESYVIFDPTGHPEDCECLNNREDGGTLVHTTSGTKHRAQWRGLISPERYELLLSALRENGQNWDHGMVRGRRYLLSGIATCGGTYKEEPCTAAMYGNGRSRGEGKYQRRYCCKRYNNHLEEVACGKVFRDAGALDAWVVEAVLYRLDTPEIAVELADSSDGAEAEELARKLTTQRKRRDLIKRQYARGEIETLDEYKTMRAEADTAIEEMQNKLNKLRSTKAAKLLPREGSIRDVFMERLEGGDLEWCRSVIKLVVERVIVKPGSPGSKTWNGFRFNPDDVEIVWRF